MGNLIFMNSAIVAALALFTIMEVCGLILFAVGKHADKRRDYK